MNNNIIISSCNLSFTFKFVNYLANWYSLRTVYLLFKFYVYILGSQSLQERRPGSGQTVYGNYENSGQQHSGLNYPSTSVGGGASSLGASMAQTPPSAVVSSSGQVIKTCFAKPSITTSSSSSPQSVWVERHLAQV